MSSVHKHTQQQRSVRWSTDAHGMWIGEADGYFIGTVERAGARHYARDCFDRYLGEYRRLDDAQKMLSAHLALTA